MLAQPAKTNEKRITKVPQRTEKTASLSTRLMSGFAIASDTPPGSGRLCIWNSGCRGSRNAMEMAAKKGGAWIGSQNSMRSTVWKRRFLTPARRVQAMIQSEAR